MLMSTSLSAAEIKHHQQIMIGLRLLSDIQMVIYNNKYFNFLHLSYNFWKTTVDMVAFSSVETPFSITQEDI